MQSKRPRWMWWAVAFAAAVLLVVVGGIAMLLHRYSQYAPVARTLPAELAAARREGLPLEPEDLRPRPPVPPAQNAAPLYRQAHAVILGLPKAEKNAVADFLVPNTREASRAGCAAVLRKLAPTLRLAERASRLPHCDFQRDYGLGPEMTIPEYPSMRHLARLFAARALMQSEAGRPLEALDSVAAGTRIARHAGEDRIIIALLVDIALQAIMDRTFLAVVSTHADDPATLNRAEETLRAFPPLPPLAHSMAGEVIMCRVAVDMVRRDPSQLQAVLRYASDNPNLRQEMADAWEARSVAYWRKVFRALKAHPGDDMAVYRTLKQMDQDLMRNANRPTYELNAILMPVFSNVTLKAASCETRRDLRRTMLDLLVYRRRAGAFPASLADLPHPPPPDRFTGKPLVYRRTAQGFVLYSVGENSRDDGGKRKSEKKGEGPPDLVAQYPFEEGL